jgi:hypothetical protein
MNWSNVSQTLPKTIKISTTYKSFCETRIALIIRQDTKSIKSENCRTSFKNIEMKTLNKILVHKITEHG